MVATRAESGLVRIHLENPTGGTLCGSHAGFETHNRDVATGWPDCQECIKATEAQPNVGWAPA